MRSLDARTRNIPQSQVSPVPLRTTQLMLGWVAAFNPFLQIRVFRHRTMALIVSAVAAPSVWVVPEYVAGYQKPGSLYQGALCVMLKPDSAGPRNDMVRTTKMSSVVRGSWT